MAAPSAALTAFAARANKLDPRSLVTEGQALIKKKEDPAQVAQLVAKTLRGIVGDLEEHGAQAEFADDAAFVRKAAKDWAKKAEVKAGASAADEVLLDPELESAVVGAVESLDLPAAEAANWKALRKSKQLVGALAKIVKKPVAPWFAELMAAYVGRELDKIFKSSEGESLQAKLADVPALIEVLVTLGKPPIFGSRAMRSANLIVLRHGDSPTFKLLMKLGAVQVPTAADKLEVARRIRLAGVRAGVKTAGRGSASRPRAR